MKEQTTKERLAKIEAYTKFIYDQIQDYPLPKLDEKIKNTGIKIDKHRESHRFWFKTMIYTVIGSSGLIGTLKLIAMALSK